MCVQPFKQQLGGVTGMRLSHASMAACVLSTISLHMTSHSLCIVSHIMNNAVLCTWFT